MRYDKATKVIIVILIIVILIIAMYWLINSFKNQLKSIVSIDINPSIQLSLDGKGKVIITRALNQEAQIILNKLN